MADELRDLLQRVEDPELRDRILKALEREGRVTPEKMLEEITKLIDELNEAARNRPGPFPYEIPAQPVTRPGHAPSVPFRDAEVVVYGPQPSPFGPGDTRDSEGGWYGTGTASDRINHYRSCPGCGLRLLVGESGGGEEFCQICTEQRRTALALLGRPGRDS